ncbi:TerB family tellurite resistance protein [Idiomarina sp.]|uniref:TerB family tellurite resistance protein n=1 Tax=Idiomarina sp. TaxID=1874361 RepID=UPI0025BB7FA5|nr:TerB family tellurite resistance protein [Idiomarina sp.]NQZ04688.1 TerB family tellurite resistance protein [Idiomarina sp.]
MFLSELNIGERKNFLELAHYSMGLNGEHKDVESMVFNSFVHECDLPGYKLQKQDKIESILKVLSKSSDKHKRILVIELYGILLADGEVCASEADFMEQLADEFGFDKKQVAELQSWVEQMNSLVEKGYDLVN